MPPSEKVNVAIIGTGGQGIVNMKQLFTESDVRIAALCDLNEESDYSMFYYGGTAGLKPATELVRQKYGQACPTYRDYNEILDKEDIDAVLLATPDHSHAMISLAVLAKRKHLYCEKPLCRTVYETRVVTEAARQAGVATQLGNFGHSSEDIRLTCEWIWDGAIGDVREVHAWTSTGARRWTNLTERPKETPPASIGRAGWSRRRPAPTIPIMPRSVGGPGGNSAPARSATSPAITWYEGGLMPPRPVELEAGRNPSDNGILFVGTKGAILGEGWGRSPRIIPEAKMQVYRRDAIPDLWPYLLSE